MIKRYDIEDWKSLYDLAESTIKLQESAIAERDELLREALSAMRFAWERLPFNDDPKSETETKLEAAIDNIEKKYPSQ